MLSCIVYPVPGSPPYGLTFESVSPSEVNVTWQPPLLPNGVITHYSLEIWNSSHYLNLTSPTNRLHIAHLRKYAHYRVMVQAHTRVGRGNFSSEPLNITTLEDGERNGQGGEENACFFYFSFNASDYIRNFEGHLIESSFLLSYISVCRNK